MFYIGEVGKPARVRTNFFEVTTCPSGDIFHYVVTIEPANTPRAIFCKVWKFFEDTNTQGLFMVSKLYLMTRRAYSLSVLFLLVRQKRKHSR